MNKEFRLGVIGAGFMSSAIINGAINANIVKPQQIIVSDVNDAALNKIAQIGVNTTKSNQAVVNQSEFVLFAIKPQHLNDVLLSIKDCNCDKFISIMAGVRKEKIKTVLVSAKVARCMPNTPCAIGYGAVGLDLSDFTENADKEFIKNLLCSFAKVVLVDEDKLNAVTGVSGSAPAYFYLFLQGVIESGVKNGLSEEDAKLLATSTMIGAGQMVLNNQDKSINDLINAVCSKGGTTIEAIKIYNESGLNAITDKAVCACVKKATELEKL